MTNPTLERWKTECDHVWMTMPLKNAKCAKCGVSRAFVEVKKSQQARERWGAK